MHRFARAVISLLLSAVILATAGGALAQVDVNASAGGMPDGVSGRPPGLAMAPADAFGTLRGAIFVAATKFAGPALGGAPLVFESNNFYTNPGTAFGVPYYAPLDGVPVGAAVDGFTCVYNDPSPTHEIIFSMMKAEQVWSFFGSTGGSRNIFNIAGFGSNGTPGISYQFVEVSPAETITHFPNLTTLRQYYLVAQVGSDTSFAGCYVFYKRQVSPAPGTASFTDVPTGHPFFQVIEALRTSGITGGCTASQFCPDGVVTRAAMAAFLARALGLAYSY